MTDTAWRVEQPSRYGKPHLYYFRTRYDAHAYAPYMEDYGAGAILTQIPVDEVSAYTEHPAHKKEHAR